MLLDNISNIPQKIFNFLYETSEQLGKETKYKQRHSKLTPSGFIRALISTSFSPFFDLETFCDFLKEQGIQIRKQSVHERFNQYTEAFLKAMSTSFLNHFQTEKLPMLNGFEAFSGLKIIDSSCVSLHGALNTLFKGCGGAASSAALKIQVQFDYLQGQINELTLTSGSDNDQGFDNYFNEIQKGALYLMDLGYFKLSSFKKIIEGDAFFVSRLLTGTKLLTLDKQPLDLLGILSTSGPLFSQQLLLGAQHKIPVRLVAQRLPKELADRRRQRLNEDHRRRGSKPSQESLALQDWSLYITNTQESQIKQEQIHQTYALRWQIELLFKLSKSLMQIHVLNTARPSRVVVQTYGKFLSLMLFFLLCAPARNQEIKAFSFFKACKLLIIKTSELAASLVSVYRLKAFILSFYESIAFFAIKDVKKKPDWEINPSTGDGF
jgi:hypothetical protein